MAGNHVDAKIRDNFFSVPLEFDENILLGDYWSHVDTLNQVSSHFKFLSIFIQVPLSDENQPI